MGWDYGHRDLREEVAVERVFGLSGVDTGWVQKEEYHTGRVHKEAWVAKEGHGHPSGPPVSIDTKRHQTG